MSFNKNMDTSSYRELGLEEKAGVVSVSSMKEKQLPRAHKPRKNVLIDIEEKDVETVHYRKNSKRERNKHAKTYSRTNQKELKLDQFSSSMVDTPQKYSENEGKVYLAEKLGSSNIEEREQKYLAQIFDLKNALKLSDKKRYQALEEKSEAELNMKALHKELVVAKQALVLAEKEARVALSNLEQKLKRDSVKRREAEDTKSKKRADRMTQSLNGSRTSLPWEASIKLENRKNAMQKQSFLKQKILETERRLEKAEEARLKQQIENLESASKIVRVANEESEKMKESYEKDISLLKYQHIKESESMQQKLLETEAQLKEMKEKYSLERKKAKRREAELMKTNQDQYNKLSIENEDLKIKITQAQLRQVIMDLKMLTLHEAENEVSKRTNYSKVMFELQLKKSKQDLKFEMYRLQHRMLLSEFQFCTENKKNHDRIMRLKHNYKRKTLMCIEGANKAAITAFHHELVCFITKRQLIRERHKSVMTELLSIFQDKRDFLRHKFVHTALLLKKMHRELLSKRMSKPLWQDYIHAREIRNISLMQRKSLNFALRDFFAISKQKQQIKSANIRNIVISMKAGQEDRKLKKRLYLCSVQSSILFHKSKQEKKRALLNDMKAYWSRRQNQILRQKLIFDLRQTLQKRQMDLRKKWYIARQLSTELKRFKESKKYERAYRKALSMELRSKRDSMKEKVALKKNVVSVFSLEIAKQKLSLEFQRKVHEQQLKSVAVEILLFFEAKIKRQTEHILLLTQLKASVKSREERIRLKNALWNSMRMEMQKRNLLTSLAMERHRCHIITAVMELKVSRREKHNARRDHSRQLLSEILKVKEERTYRKIKLLDCVNDAINAQKRKYTIKKFLMKELLHKYSYTKKTQKRTAKAKKLLMTELKNRFFSESVHTGRRQKRSLLNEIHEFHSFRKLKKAEILAYVKLAIQVNVLKTQRRRALSVELGSAHASRQQRMLLKKVWHETLLSNIVIEATQDSQKTKKRFLKSFSYVLTELRMKFDIKREKNNARLIRLSTELKSANASRMHQIYAKKALYHAVKAEIEKQKLLEDLAIENHKIRLAKVMMELISTKEVKRNSSKMNCRKLLSDILHEKSQRNFRKFKMSSWIKSAIAAYDYRSRARKALILELKIATANRRQNLLLRKLFSSILKTSIREIKKARPFIEKEDHKSKLKNVLIQLQLELARIQHCKKIMVITCIQVKQMKQTRISLRMQRKGVMKELMLCHYLRGCKALVLRNKERVLKQLQERQHEHARNNAILLKNITEFIFKKDQRRIMYASLLNELKMSALERKTRQHMKGVSMKNISSNLSFYFETKSRKQIIESRRNVKKVLSGFFLGHAHRCQKQQYYRSTCLVQLLHIHLIREKSKIEKKYLLKELVQKQHQKYTEKIKQRKLSVIQHIRDIAIEKKAGHGSKLKYRLFNELQVNLLKKELQLERRKSLTSEIRRASKAKSTKHELSSSERSAMKLYLELALSAKDQEIRKLRMSQILAEMKSFFLNREVDKAVVAKANAHSKIIRFHKDRRRIKRMHSMFNEDFRGSLQIL